jgi:hypothetical protein
MKIISTISILLICTACTTQPQPTVWKTVKVLDTHYDHGWYIVIIEDEEGNRSHINQGLGSTYPIKGESWKMKNDHFVNKIDQ